MLIAAGVVLSLFGAIGDAAGTWDDLPFLTNLASSLTGALFGIPIALLVVQRLLQVQADANEKAAAWNLALQFSRSMRDRMQSLCGRAWNQSSGELVALVTGCRSAVEEARAWKERAFAAKPRPKRERASMYQRAYLREVLKVHTALSRALVLLDENAVDAERSAGEMRRLRGEAGFLHDEVRPIVLRLGDTWLPEDHCRALKHAGETFPDRLPLPDAAAVQQIGDLLRSLQEPQLKWLLGDVDGPAPDPSDADRPHPLPPFEYLLAAQRELERISGHFTRVERIRRVVEDIHDTLSHAALRGGTGPRR